MFQAHDSPVRSMVWSHNDVWMVTGDHGGYIKYWQSNMNNVKMFQAHKEAIRGIRYRKPNQTKNKTSILIDCDIRSPQYLSILYFHKCSSPNNTSTFDSQKEEKRNSSYPSKLLISVIDVSEDNKREFFFNPLFKRLNVA